MIKVNLQLLGGRGASGFRSSVGKLIDDLLGKGRDRELQPLDASRYGGMLEAEGAIRGLKRERALIYEDIARSPEFVFQGDRHSVAFPAAAVKPTTTLTHNHPDRRHGGTFSYGDMGNATTLNMRGHRAVAREGTYYMNPTAKARPLDFNRRIAKDIPMLERRMRKAAEGVIKRYEKGKITEAQMRGMRRQVITGELHRYYKKTAPQYGYVYGRQKLTGTYR